MELTLVSVFTCHASHAVLGVRVVRVRTHDAYNASTLASWVAMCGPGHTSDFVWGQASLRSLLFNASCSKKWCGEGRMA